MYYLEKSVVAKETVSNECNDVLRSAKLGDEGAMEYIMQKYGSLVRFRSKAYFIAGADAQDVVQEGMIGLYRAIKSYNIDSGSSSFHTFAEMCIKRQIMTAITRSRRQKHMPLNSYVPMNGICDECDNIAPGIFAGGIYGDPENIVLSREEVLELKGKVDSILSGLEKKVFGLYMEGMSYSEIADKLGKTLKSVDNALQRIKRKAELHIGCRND